MGHWAVGLPLSVLLGFQLSYGAAGIWWGLSAGLTSMADGIGECIDFDSGTDCTP